MSARARAADMRLLQYVRDGQICYLTTSAEHARHDWYKANPQRRWWVGAQIRRMINDGLVEFPRASEGVAELTEAGRLSLEKESPA